MTIEQIKNSMLNIFQTLPHVKYRLLMAQKEEEISRLEEKVDAIENFFFIEFCKGKKNVPHYRAKRIAKKKLGRPRKVK